MGDSRDTLDVLIGGTLHVVQLYRLVVSGSGASSAAALPSDLASSASEGHSVGLFFLPRTPRSVLTTISRQNYKNDT